MKKEKFYISKYALTAGIRHAVLEVTDDGKYASERYAFYKIGCDVHRSREAAVAAAEAIRLRRIASLKKSLAALEKMTWDAS